MIHTDGTPTIANAPRAAEQFEATTVAPSIEGTRSLLIRQYAGLTVNVRWVEGTEHLLLCVARGDEKYAAVIDGKDAQDAFDHPYVYLAQKGIEFNA